jgi:hypothetical protein
MQCSLAPRIACIRAVPLTAAHPDPRRALIARQHGRVAEVPAAGAMQQVSADSRHVPQLRRGPRQQRLPDQRQPLTYGRVVGQPAIVVSAPTMSASPQMLIPRSGRRPMSISRPGSITASFSSKSTSVVPPAR